ncbi:phosphatase PAP2 family protein [Paenibacillus motobuensis]|uniref:phosphatase PAP2 family protein n=1 Tax=Paenibacillus TaxID=44249 RepID=UPI002041F117|nr:MULTISPECIES: phosphatase PAP2 family protein [Paenibacillus]MCM3039341.1 phosphatase PAP2 family protein [Paenibacillus lutimineralis]MCM3646445.1 phosphatase PAP2 family protein [Paenibacillus motobuensis]
MNIKLKFSYIFFLSLLCLAGFGMIAYWIGGAQIHNFDNTIISLVQGQESDSLTKIMKVFTWIGSQLPVIVILLVTLIFLYFVLHHRSELVFLIIIVSGSALLNILLKQLFRRDRPSLHRLIEETGFSFPSGHSMAAFSLYGAIVFLVWKHIPYILGRIAVIVGGACLILMIGVSRIYLGVHFPSDVLGGYLISACWLTVSIWLYQGYLEASYEKKRRFRRQPK